MWGGQNRIAVGYRMTNSYRPRKAMSYGLMRDEEARLEREIAGLLKQAEALDRSEDANTARTGTMGTAGQVSEADSSSRFDCRR